VHLERCSEGGAGTLAERTDLKGAVEEWQRSYSGSGEAIEAVIG
jgi:hypothetical protein